MQTCKISTEENNNWSETAHRKQQTAIHHFVAE